ncbi:MAG: hypothetical protein GXY83_44035 [Rhodopirellula sp.]|nr:hypothetical protein [Rhodopirellula sp.]
MPTQVTTTPAPYQIPPAGAIFDAVFDRSLDFRIELPYETAIDFLRRIDKYNDFEAARVIEALERIDQLIQRINGGPGRPTSGNRDYSLSIGRESSPVIYLERWEFAPNCPIPEKCLKDICEEMRIWGRADEATYEIEDFPCWGKSRKITFRFWWD